MIRQVTQQRIVMLLALLLAVPPGNAPAAPQQCPVSTKVFHAYSECNADGFWHVVTDEYFRCPDNSVRPVRIADRATDQPCDGGQAAPTLEIINQVLQPGESGVVDGVFIRLECIAGTWHRVGYPRIVLPDGSTRRDPRLASLENTGQPCAQPAPRPVANAQALSLGVTPTESFNLALLLDAATASPVMLNPAPTAEAEADPGVQQMMIESVVEDLQDVVVIASGERQPPHRAWAGGLWNAMRQLVRPARESASPMLTAADTGFRPDRRRNRAVWLAPIDGPAEARATQKPAELPPVRMLLTSLGTSTGEAFQAAIVNDGDKPILIDGMRLVVEPLKRDAARRARSAIQKFQARKPTTVKMTGYCLEFLRPPPMAGTLFRVVPRRQQQQFDPMRRILEAGQRLRRAGRLTPDSEPTGYYHAIRQWAIWTTEQGFSEGSFTDAFVEHTKKAATASGRAWSSTMEQTLRKAAPGRWRDIQQVLAEAAGR